MSVSMKNRVRSGVALVVAFALFAEPLGATGASASSVDPSTTTSPSTTTPDAPSESPFDDADSEIQPAVRLSFDGSRLAPLGGKMFVKFTAHNATSFPTAVDSPLTVRFTSLPPGVTLSSVYPAAESGKGGWTCSGTSCSTAVPVSPLGSVDGLATFDVAADAALGSLEQSLLEQLLSSARTNIDKAALQQAFASMTEVSASMSAKVNGQSIVSDASYKVTAVPRGTSIGVEVFAFMPPSTVEGRVAAWTLIATNPGSTEVSGLTVTQPFATSALTDTKAEGANWTCASDACGYGVALAPGALSEPLVLSGVVPAASAALDAPSVAWQPAFSVGTTSGSVDLGYLPVLEEPPNVVVTLTPTGGVPLTTVGAEVSLNLGLATIGGPARKVALSIESAGATFASASGLTCEPGTAAACEVAVVEPGKPVNGVVRFRVNDDAGEGLVIAAKAVAPGEAADKTADNSTSTTLVVRQKGEPIPVLFPAKRDGAGAWSLDAITVEPLTPTKPDTVAYVVKNVGSEPVASGTALKVSAVFPQVVTVRAAGDWSCVDNPTVDRALLPSEGIMSAATDAAKAVGADAEVVGADAWQQFDCSLTTSGDVAADAQLPAVVFNLSAPNIVRSIAGGISARLVSGAESAAGASQSVARILVVDVPRIEVQSFVGDAAPVRRGASSKAKVKVENRGETAVTPVLLAAADAAAGIDSVDGDGLACIRIGGSLAIGVALCRADQSSPDEEGPEAQVSIRPQGPATEGAWSYRVVPIAVGRAVVVGGTTAGLVRETAPLTIDASGPDMVSDFSFRSRANTMEPTRVALYAVHNGSTVEWKQTAGPIAVTLAKDAEGNVSFTAPDVDAATNFTFRATVRDESASASDEVTVRVEPIANYRAPAATAQSSSFSNGGNVRTLPFRAERPTFATTTFRPASKSLVYRRVFLRSTPTGVDSPPATPVEPWAAGGSPIRVRADAFGSGTVSVAPGAAVTVVGASTAGVTWTWAIDSGDSGLVDAPAIVAAVSAATGPTLRFTAPMTTGIVRLRATVTASGLSASDIVTVKVGDAAAPAAITFDVAGPTRPLIVVSGGRRDVIATSPAGSTVTWSLAPASVDVTLTSTAAGVRISGTTSSRPVTGVVSAIARDAAGRIVALGGFPLVVTPVTTFGSLCDVTTAAASGLLRSIPGVSGLDLSTEVAAAGPTCAAGTRLTFSGKSFTFAGISAVNISGSLDTSGLKFTGGTLDFPASWPIDDVALGEDSGSVIAFRNIGGISLGRPTVRLRGALSASLSTALSAFGGWTWTPTISIENGNLRSIWLRGDGPARADGSRASLSARAVPAANGETTFEVAAAGVEIISGLRADITGTIGTGAAAALNLRGSVVGTWAPFTGALMSNMSMTFATGQPTSISGTLALSTGGLAGLSVGARITFSSSEQWSLAVDASQTRDLTVVDGVVLRGAAVSGGISRNAANITGSLEFRVPSIAINSFAEISDLRATAGLECRVGAACDARFTIASSLVLRTATPTSINVTGSVDTAARTLRLTGSVNSLAITPTVTLSTVAFTYENRAGVVSTTATATARVFDTDVSVNVAFKADSTVVTGGINNLRLFGNGGPEVSAEIAFVVNADRAVSWNPTTPALQTLSLPTITLAADTIHLTAAVTTPSAFRTFLGNVIPEKFVVRANYASRRFTLLGREAGGQVGGTVAQDASGWRWDASLSLNGDFEFFRGVSFRAPTIRVRGGGGADLKFGLSGNLAFNLTGSEFVVPFELPSLDSADWTINLQTPAGFNVEPITGLRLETLGGSIRRQNNQVTVAVSFSQAARATWQPFAGFTVNNAAVSASATCASLENLESCETTFSMRGSITVPSAAGAVDFTAVKDAAGWTITAQVGEIRLAPGVRLTAASASIVIPTSGSTTASAQGTFNILDVNLTASVRYSEQGVVLTAGIRGTWEPIPGGPSFSDASVAFATYAVANFDPMGSPAPQQLPANDPTFFGAVNMPQGVLRALGLEGVRIEPVGLSLGNISSGNFGFNIAINTGGPKWIVNFGGKGLRLTELGIRIAMRNYVPTFGLYGAAELVVPSQPSGVPLVLDLTVTATGGLSIAATLGIDANGQERPWTNAFGVSGLTVRALAISFSLQPPNPFPGFGAGLSIELPASIRDLLGMSRGVVITAILNVQVDSMCLSLTASGPTANDKVVNILGGALSASRLEMTFAPLGCTVGRMTVAPGIRATFRGSILGVPLDIAANLDIASATFEASVSIGAFNVGPLRLEETTFEMATYGLRPLDSYVRFSGALSIGSTRVRASINVRNDGFDFSGSIDNLSLVPGLVEVKQARVAGGFDISDVRMNLNVVGSVEVLRQALNVSLDLNIDRSGVRSMRGSVDASLSLGDLLRIEGSFSFNMSLDNPSIAVSGRVTAAGFNLLEVSGSINRNALSVSARTDVFGIFQGSVTGKVVWCNAGNSERIRNVMGQEIIAQSGDFYFATDVNVNMSFAGFNASGSVKFGYSAPSGSFPQRQACGGNGQRAVGTPSTTTSSTSSTSSTLLARAIQQAAGNNMANLGGATVSTMPRATVVPTTSTVAITAPGGLNPRVSVPGAVVTTAAPRTTTTVARSTTTLAPSPPVARQFFGEVSASLELGGNGFGGTARISGSFSTGGDISLRGSVNLDLTVVQARATVELTRTGGFFRFAVDTTVSLAGANVRLTGTFERSRGRTTFDLSGSANVNLYVASVSMAFRVNNNGFVATGRVAAGSRSWAYFSASATMAFTSDGWLVDVGGELVILSGLVNVSGRLAIGNLQCNARMQCERVRSFAKLTASFPIGPFQFSVNASLLNGFSLEVGSSWTYTTGRLDLGNCWGRGKAELSATLYIRENPARNQARVELVGRAGVYGKLWGDWCWPGTPDNERDRWPYSVSASISVTFDPWGVTVSVHLGVPNFTIGPVAGIRIRVT